MPQLAVTGALTALLIISPGAISPGFSTATPPRDVTASAARTDADGFWFWPVDSPRAILRPFIAPVTPYASGHRGLDLAAEQAALYAPADGTVRFAGTVVDRPVLSIDHGNGVISSYEPVLATVKQGDPVARGQPIGTVIEGHCATLCVHIGVRVNGEYLSPLSYFGTVPRSVLLPTRHPE